MPSPLNYDGGLTAGLPVRDLNTAVAWYMDVLGFTLNYQMDEMGWAELATETPGLTIGLSQVEEMTLGGGATLTFGVHNLAAARAILEAKNVRFDGETETIPEMVAICTFYDPDGNTLMLYQDLSGAT
ncbi:MAG: VOC family protein [Myxococcota bacterium]